MSPSPDRIHRRPTRRRQAQKNQAPVTRTQLSNSELQAPIATATTNDCDDKGDAPVLAAAATAGAINSPSHRSRLRADGPLPFLQACTLQHNQLHAHSKKMTTKHRNTVTRAIFTRQVSRCAVVATAHRAASSAVAWLTTASMCTPTTHRMCV